MKSLLSEVARHLPSFDHEGLALTIFSNVVFLPAEPDAEARLECTVLCPCSGMCDRCDGSGFWEVEIEGSAAELAADDLGILLPAPPAFIARAA